MAKRKAPPQLTAEDFAAWREDPTTLAILDLLASFADAQKAAWDDHSWDSGKADPLMLCELRTRADAYRAMGEMTFERLMQAAEWVAQ